MVRKRRPFAEGEEEGRLGSLWIHTAFSLFMRDFSAIRVFCKSFLIQFNSCFNRLSLNASRGCSLHARLFVPLYPLCCGIHQTALRHFSTPQHPFRKPNSACREIMKSPAHVECQSHRLSIIACPVSLLVFSRGEE